MAREVPEPMIAPVGLDVEIVSSPTVALDVAPALGVVERARSETMTVPRWSFSATTPDDSEIS